MCPVLLPHTSEKPAWMWSQLSTPHFLLLWAHKAHSRFRALVLAISSAPLSVSPQVP